MNSKHIDRWFEGVEQIQTALYELNKTEKVLRAVGLSTAADSVLYAMQLIDDGLSSIKTADKDRSLTELNEARERTSALFSTVINAIEKKTMKKPQLQHSESCNREKVIFMKG